MIKKIFFLALFLFNFFAVIYLIAPTPTFPDLPHSAKSDLPGGTVQIPNVSGYFTNLSRTEVINFYKANYNGFFRLQLNHPPEKAKEVIVDTIPSYYFEEFYLPFKESLYINGFEWENDVFTKPDKRIKNRLIYQDKEYKAKITVRTFPVPIYQRLLAFFLVEISLGSIFLLYRSFLRHRP